MLRSSFCTLATSSDQELTDMGECPYDQVRNLEGREEEQSHGSWLGREGRPNLRHRTSHPHDPRGGDFTINAPHLQHHISHSHTTPPPARNLHLNHPTCNTTPPQGGYFIINGSEKVLIAQERMATNHVYVFKKSQPSKYTYIAECRRAGGGRGGVWVRERRAGQQGKRGSAQIVRAPAAGWHHPVPSPWTPSQLPLPDPLKLR